MWRFLFSDLGDPFTKVIDYNNGDIQIGVNLVTNPYSNHIDVRRHHFLQELVEKEEFEIPHVKSNLVRWFLDAAPIFLPFSEECCHQHVMQVDSGLRVCSLNDFFPWMIRRLRYFTHTIQFLRLSLF